MNENARALFEKAEASVSAARLLTDQRYHDFAASRAYYGMFYVAEALLASRGQSYSTDGGVVGAFGREFAKTGKLNPEFHRWLIDAQDIRNMSDYGVGVETTAEQAIEVIRQADEFLKAGRDYLQSLGTEAGP
jgi:uncharacterized protein (UPF0332 family)